VRYPKGTTGSRSTSWRACRCGKPASTIDHGTGHGVGSYLGVHEGPHRISKVGNTVALEPGMIVSNEPGYYKADAWGIRIENLQVVTEGEAHSRRRPRHAGLRNADARAARQEA
jgi:Xaa-Pro aminopeptidase